jgi:hypothetical protein
MPIVSTVDGFQGVAKIDWLKMDHAGGQGERRRWSYSPACAQRPMETLAFWQVSSAVHIAALTRQTLLQSDLRRQNVALTRARHSLIVIGKAESLVQHEDWRPLVQFMKSKDRLLSVHTFAFERVV